MIQEFKDFIAKGNVMDMAVGIIIGARVHCDRHLYGRGPDKPDYWSGSAVGSISPITTLFWVVRFRLEQA